MGNWDGGRRRVCRALERTLYRWRLMFGGIYGQASSHLDDHRERHSVMDVCVWVRLQLMLQGRHGVAIRRRIIALLTDTDVGTESWCSRAG